MQRVLVLLLGTILIATAAGCSSGPFSDRYYDVVDNLHEHDVYFDNVYYWYCKKTRCAKYSPFGNCY